MGREHVLDQSVDARSQRLGQRLGDVHGLDREAVSGVAGERLERGHEAELGQRCGPQLPGEIPHIVEHADDLPLELVKRSAGRALARGGASAGRSSTAASACASSSCSVSAVPPTVVLLRVEQLAEPGALFEQRRPSAASPA